MNKTTRKTFLKTATAALVGLLGFLYPGAGGAIAAPVARSASAQPGPVNGANVKRLVGPDPTFASGEVIERSHDSLILSSAAGVRAVHLPADTVVWKEFDVGPDAIALHDWVDVKGTPNHDGTLLARNRWVFVNIGRRDGVVEGSSDGGIKLRTRRGVEVLDLSSRLEVISASDGAPIPGGLAALLPGTAIGAVGLRLPNGRVRATRIWTTA
jgi:Domain of unknown function (DUF5666)